MGGFHVNFFPDEAAEHTDALVIGDAEGVWEQLLQDSLANKFKKASKEMRSIIWLGSENHD